MDRIPIFDSSVDAFVLLTWALTLTSSIWFAVTFRRKRFLFVKPSMLVLFWSHCFIQWPATVYAAYYEKVLPDPYAFSLLINGFVLTGLLVSTHTFHRGAEVAFHRLLRPQPQKIVYPALALAAYCAAVTAIYLRVVPLTATGLYVIFTHPALAAVAREDSLELVASAPLQYAYQIMVNAVAPLLAVFLALAVSHCIHARRRISALTVLLAFLVLLLAVSLPGNRGAAAKLLLVVGVSGFLVRGLPFRPLQVLLGIAAILTPAVLITLFREGKDFSSTLFLNYLTEAIFNRVFIVPANVGAFYVHYAQIHGPFGIAGISRLASFLGVQPIRAANIIGNLYTYAGIESVGANAGFLFTYYGYFGISSLPLSLLGLWLLDLAVPIYLRLEPRVFLPAVAAASVASFAFISSEYTTVLLTHGFGVILLLSVALGRLLRSKGSGGPPASDSLSPMQVMPS